MGNMHIRNVNAKDMNFNDKNIKVTTASGLELNYFLVKVGRPGV